MNPPQNPPRTPLTETEARPTATTGGLVAAVHNAYLEHIVAKAE